jgi:hypothetical protein
MDDAFDHRLLGEVAGHVERLAQTTPAGDLPAALPPIVRRTLVAVRPDGTWPEAALLREALRAYVDLVDEALATQAIGEDALAAPDRRWLDACRQCVESERLFEDLLEDLRASLPSPGPRWADTRPGRRSEGRGQPCTPPSTVKD